MPTTTTAATTTAATTTNNITNFIYTITKNTIPLIIAISSCIKDSKMGVIRNEIK